MTASGISKIAIGAIVKENSTTLLEWIAYHRIIGVEYFWIADNGSGAATRQLLLDLDRLGIVNYIPFPSKPGEKPQLHAYNQILERARDFGGVLAFIDADEFLVPDQGSLRPFVEKAFEDESVSALALNWACFGSNGALFAEDGLVIERFTRRAKQEFANNLNFKSIVRPERVEKFLNPHFAKLLQGHYVDATGGNLVMHPQRGAGLSAEVLWKGARVNHYAVKSLEEFLLVKHLRGSSATPNKVKHKEYFVFRDRNDEECLLAARFAPQVRAEISRLKTKQDQLLSCLHPAQFQPYRSLKSTVGLRWQPIQQHSGLDGESLADHSRILILQAENHKQGQLLEELNIFTQRLFRSWQYRFGSTIGSLIRTLLLRTEKRSLPESRIRHALEQYAKIRKTP